MASGDAPYISTLTTYEDDDRHCTKYRSLISYCFMFDKAVPVNDSVIAGLSDRITYHVINSCFGGICIIFNILLLGIFLGHRPFRSRYVLLIQLCVGDLIYSISVVLAGLQQIQLYSTVFQTLTLPVRTTMECAMEPWLILRIIGYYFSQFYPRYSFSLRCCLHFVSLTRTIRPTTTVDGKQPLGTDSELLFTSPMCCAMYSPQYLVRLHTGRRVAWPNLSESCIKRQVATIRYYLLISVLSTLLVSLPNTIALFQVYVKAVSDAISKPSVWMQTINSGIHLFVYLTLNREFRIRAFSLLRMEINDGVSLMKPSIADGIEAPLRGYAKRSNLIRLLHTQHYMIISILDKITPFVTNSSSIHVVNLS
uniref:G_PROTEIN_RECEP_F1_2 domain-containing protein n=1 Tax=Heterorhabditis bacteriophora TaxID=37862 RepID=A0A1I7WRK4_HETBA